MNAQTSQKRECVWFDFAVLTVPMALFFISRSNYLVFHTLVETLTINVVLFVFVSVLNAYPYFDNDFFDMIGK
jgi:hypothetical protein